ncbi:type II secretion system F family protein [Nesterenkonia populi]
MTAEIIWAGAAGLGVGLGLLLIAAGAPAMNQPQLAERIAPYVRSSAPGASDGNVPTVLTGAAGIFKPFIESAAAQLDRFSIDAAQLTRRLDQADLQLTVAQYRLQQLAAAAGAVGLTVLVNAFAAVSGRFNAPLAVVLLGGAAVIGIAARDCLLNARTRRRRRRMLEEFPAVAEMMALAVGAGESAPAAFERIGRLSRGELAAEFTRMLHHTRSGASFPEACRELSRRLDLPPLGRFLDGVLVAVERGTPLAEVMRAQAADVQELSKRELMEAAGRKEIGMLVPLVFGIMPLTVLFAVFPGAALLSSGT